MRNKDFYSDNLDIDKVYELVDYLRENYTFKEIMKAFRELAYAEVAYYSESNKAPIYSKNRDELNIEQASRLQQKLSRDADLFTQSINGRTFDEEYLKQYNI